MDLPASTQIIISVKLHVNAACSVYNYYIIFYMHNKFCFLEISEPKKGDSMNLFCFQYLLILNVYNDLKFATLG